MTKTLYETVPFVTIYIRSKALEVWRIAEPTKHDNSHVNTI